MYKERKRSIFKTLIKQYGKKEANDMYGEFIGYRTSRCVVCSSEIFFYSEWRDTGFEETGCKNGCWNHKTYGLIDALKTKGFNYYGEGSKEVMDSFNDQIKRNATKSKKMKRIFWNKKNSQRKK